MDVDGERISSFPSTSKQTFIGIKVSTPVVNIKEGETAIIHIQPTVPIGCIVSGGCNLTVTSVTKNVSSSNGCEPLLTVKDGCGVSIITSEWDKGYQLEITSTVTEVYGHRVTQKKVLLRTESLHLHQPFWQNYFLDPVTINIAKNTTQQKICIFKNDPYLTDFNSRWTPFDLAGTFYLFKLDNIEVQVQVTNCSERFTGYCICGAVIRVGRTAFMINLCHQPIRYIDYILCEDGGDILDITTPSTTEFETYLPSGTKIKLELFESGKYGWVNVYITPSVRDIGKTSGLCGELTDDQPASVKYDDKYFNSWRVKNGVNFFTQDKWTDLSKWNALNTSFQHCLCDAVDNKLETTLNCTIIPVTTTCSSGSNHTLFPKKRCISPARKKRSLPRMTQSHIVRHQRFKRDVSWKNGWTMNSASEYCSDLFNNSMVIKRCEGIKGLNIESAIETCVSDIRLSGTDVFSLSAISSVSSQCVYEARMNRTLRDEKVENGKTILELVKEVDCPGQCSGQGICEDGTCICNSEYIGSDCSVPINKPPLAHSLEADGYCDISEEDCNDVAVFGGRFVDHDQTTCKMFSFEINNDQVTVSEETEIQTAIFETIGEVTCQLPSRKRKRRSVDVPVIDETVTGYKVSVSNNGQNYSEQLTMIIYNTECMNCAIENGNNVTCSFSSNYCIMDARCYSNGAIYDTGDIEYVCKADGNGKAWFPKPGATVTSTTPKDNGNGDDNDDGNGDKDDDDAVVIGVSVTVAVVLLVILSIIIFYFVRKRTFRKYFLSGINVK